MRHAADDATCPATDFTQGKRLTPEISRECGLDCLPEQCVSLSDTATEGLLHLGTLGQ